MRKGHKVGIRQGFVTSSGVAGGCGITWNQRAIAQAVDAQRQRQRLTLRALAKMLGLRVTVLSRLQHGTLPQGDNLAAILYWLGIPFPLGFVTITCPPAQGDTKEPVTE